MKLWKKFSVVLVVLILAIALVGCSFNIVLAGPSTSPIEDQTPPNEKLLIEPGEVFRRGSYVEFEGVEILYNGSDFEVYNGREADIILTAAIVGVKKDGTYDLIQLPAFGGVDTYQYNKDLEENGWAIEQLTNRIRSGETLIMTMTIFDFGDPPSDIDQDGYYDITFTIHPQRSEDSIITSTSDPESPVYKLPVE